MAYPCQRNNYSVRRDGRVCVRRRSLQQLLQRLVQGSNV
jgi:hypothetical protein